MKTILIAVLTMSCAYAQEFKGQYAAGAECSAAINRLENCQTQMQKAQDDVFNAGGNKAPKNLRDILEAKSGECTQLQGAALQKCPEMKAALQKKNAEIAEREAQKKKEKAAKEEYDSKKYERMAEEHIKKAKEKAAKQKAADEAEAAFDALPDANSKVDKDAQVKKAEAKPFDKKAHKKQQQQAAKSVK